jgi:hypothetical protein
MRINPFIVRLLTTTKKEVSMFVQFTLNKIEARKIRDNPYNPLDKKSEFYQTWQICDLDRLVPLENNPKSDWARQGFSVKGAPDDGTSFAKGELRRVDDPHITFNLPTLKDGEIRRFRFDMHWWESDSSTEKVRGVFTDSTLKVLVKAWKAANQDKAAAKELLEKWLRENTGDIAKAVAKAAHIAGQPWVAVAFNMLPLFELIIDVVRNNSDDYLAMHRFILEIAKEQKTIKWRVISAGVEDVPSWYEGEGTQKITREMSDADGENVVIATYRCRILE